jgi:TonB family protein
MKNKFLMKYVKPYLFSLFFTVAMSALLWISVTYGSFAFMPIAAGLCALLYSALALAALVNLFRGNKLFEGSSSDVLSVRTQKNIRIAGIAIALPALVYCGIFAYLVKSYDLSEAACQQVAAFENLELKIFGRSKIWEAIAAYHSTALPPVTSAPASPEPAPVPLEAPTISAQKDVDFGPYMANMQVRIKKAWHPDRSDRSKHTEVYFNVDTQGNVSKLRIDRSSGSAVSDKAALDAVQDGAPYVLPDGAPDNVDIKFSFDYNTFSSTENPDVTSDGEHLTETAEFGDAFSSSAASDAVSTATN